MNAPPRRPPPRLLLLGGLAALLALCAVLWLPGCGADDVAGCRVRILTSDDDGPVDVPLSLELVSGEGGVFPLTALAGGEPGEMFAAGAPSGFYRVVAEDGWGMLWIGDLPFLSDESHTAQEFPMARGPAIYVGARDFERGQVGIEWVVEREVDGVRRRIEIEPRFSFFQLVALPFPAAEWRGRVFLTGRMADGTVVRSFSENLGPNPPNRPRLVFAQSAGLLPLAVHVVPLVPGTDVEVHVEVEPQGAAVVDRFREPATGGVAGFSAVPDLDVPVRVFLPDAAEAWWFDIPLADLRRLGCAYVLADGGPRVELTGAGPDVDLVQARGPGSRVYGRLSIEHEGTRVFVRAPVGPQHWLVRSGSAWTALDVEIPAAGGAVALTGRQAGATVRGRVLDPRRGEGQPVGPGFRLLFFRQEGDLAILGNEFDVAIGSDGRYEARLPAGTYAARIQYPRGVLGDPIPIELGSGVLRRQTFELPD